MNPSWRQRERCAGNRAVRDYSEGRQIQLCLATGYERAGFRVSYLTSDNHLRKRDSSASGSGNAVAARQRTRAWPQTRFPRTSGAMFSCAKPRTGAGGRPLHPSTVRPGGPGSNAQTAGLRTALLLDVAVVQLRELGFGGVGGQVRLDDLVEPGVVLID